MDTFICASLLLGGTKDLTLPFLMSGFKPLQNQLSLLITAIFYHDFYNTLLSLSYLGPAGI